MHQGFKHSQELFAAAIQVMPGGVNSPVRAYKAVSGTPPFIRKGQGPWIIDEDGNTYLDYVGSWGPLILGHLHPRVVAALQQCLEWGTSFGAPTCWETELAELVCELVPSIEMIRMVNSGTEATMSALRLARAYTGRTQIIKFEGCYHGHADQLLIKAGSGALTLGTPTSPGVPASIASGTIVLPFNDLEAVDAALQHFGESVAAIIIEPVAGNMGCVPPEPGYLEGLRHITSQYGVLLIFDEVMTGFRVAPGGAQQLYGVTPDLTCLGKIIGGGLPVGAYGGRKEIMELVSPAGPVYQAGTLSGNPMAMSAGLATLRQLREPGVYQQLEARSAQLEQGLRQAAAEAGIPVTLNRVASMFTAFFTDQPVRDYGGATSSDTAAFASFFNAMLLQGVYLAPSQFEAGFVSLAHSQENIEQTINAATAAFTKLKSMRG